MTGHAPKPGGDLLVAIPTANDHIGKRTRASFRILK
jgi:hypothetical protein